MAEEKVRFQMRISPDTDRKVKAAIPLANCKSQNEFVEEALNFYCDYLSTRNFNSAIPTVYLEALRGTIVNAKPKMSIFAETECHFSAVSIAVYTAVIHHITCQLEARQALIYQLVLGLTGENGKYNYSRAVHVYPPLFDIPCSAKNCKIAPALTTIDCSEGRIARLLFKLAVEQDMMMNVLAAGLEINTEELDALRGRCVRDVKRTSGAISFKDVVKYQNRED